MIIKSIRLKNFRQYRDAVIEFSTDPEKNVTVVMGDNGTGKTTLAQAFLWVLYEKTAFKITEMLNLAAKAELEEGDTIDVEVELKIIYNEREYTITRKRTYSKTKQGKAKDVGRAVFRVTYMDENGELKYEVERRIHYLIRQILPEDLSRFFFFDGERIEEMSKEIQAGKSKEFKEAVYSLVGLQATQNTLKHLSGTRNTVISYYVGEIEKNNKSQQKMNLYHDKIDDLRHKLERASHNLEVKREELHNCKKDIEECERIIYEETPQMKLKKQYEALLAEAEKLKHQKDTQIGELMREFSRGLYTFCVNPLAEQAEPLLVTEREDSQEEIPDLTYRMIRYLVEHRKRCLCGTAIEENSPVHQELTGLLQQVSTRKSDHPVEKYQDWKKRLEDQSDDFLKVIQNKIRNIEEIDSSIKGKEEDAEEKSNHMANTKKGEMAKKKKEELEQLRDRLSENIGALETEIRNFSSELQRQETEKEKLVVVNESTRRNNNFLIYAQNLYDILYKGYQEKEVSCRKRLEQRMNEIFQKIYDGNIQIELDDKYRIKVSLQETYDLEDQVERNTAQGYALIFAFISAIIDLAKERKNEKAIEDSELIDITKEGYPIVMDAPLSAFDKTRIKSICTEIPKIADQVIIFIKDTDGDIAEEHMEAKIGKRYLIRQVNGSKLHSEVVGR